MKRTKHTTIEEVLEHTRARIEEHGDGGGGGCLIGNDVDIWTAHRCRITVEDAKRRRLASMAEGTMPLPFGNDDDYASRSEKIPYGMHSFVIHTLSWRATDIDIWIAKIELELFYTRPGIPVGISNIPS
ncbi:MAG: hypothetical protein WC919_06035 [Candidatus Paceibacterota bacterium]|jgi:hypothetical protein